MIRVCEPHFLAEDRERLLRAFDRNEIARGEDLTVAERLLAENSGRPGHLVCNGTAACHLCMLLMNVQRGDRVGIPALTYIATANSVRYQDGVPVFVDVREDRPVMPASAISDLAAAGATGVWSVSLYGRCMDDLPEFMDRASRAGLWVVEDVAEGFSSQVAGRPVGTFGRAAAFSFYANKNITAGQGGAVTVDSPALLRRLALLMNQGVDAQGSFDHEFVGYNYRMTNLQAALLVGQLQRLDGIIDAKRRLQRWYEERLERCALGRMLTFDEQEVPWLCSFVLDDAGRRDSVIARLREKGIETRRAFTPLPSLKPYGAIGDDELAARFPNSRWWSRHLLNLPSALSLKEEQVDFIVGVLAEA